ncbi:uncharacterized protein [Euwallacea similis]|uniref:uncharacterized protein n=1 Tax=Euwallacea similis TaxID=1736056 RepID=UPI00344B6EDB
MRFPVSIVAVFLAIFPLTINTSAANPTFSKDEKTIEVYVPYNVKYVPAEVASKPSSKEEDFVLLPLSTFSNLPSGVNNSTGAPPHKISKRQTRLHRFYRPVFRFSRLSSNRRRFGGFRGGGFRRASGVGYLNDRDYFPTVA